jgi:hypothetical protein
MVSERKSRRRSNFGEIKRRIRWWIGVNTCSSTVKVMLGGSFNSSLSIRALGVAEQKIGGFMGSVALRLWRIQCVESTCLKYCFATAAEWKGKARNCEIVSSI